MSDQHKCPFEGAGQQHADVNGGRRRILRISAAVVAGVHVDLSQALASVPEDLRPQRGDRLVAAGGDGTPKPLRLDDVKAGAKPLHAFPYDAAGKVVRDGSRFNKVLLVRLDPAKLDEKTRARSADGVLAFSSICTHEACDVTEWVAKEEALLCFCHFSKFSPLESGRVLAGPATRSLPYLPLTVTNGEITVAGSFSAPPGAKKPG